MADTVRPEILDLLRKVVNEDIDNFSVTVHDANKKGEGYLGQMCYISLEHKTSGVVHHFAVKLAFEDKVIRESQAIPEVFENEIYYYDKVWPCLKQFQEEVKIFDKVAKCFTTSREGYYETLVLENLKYQGFEMFDKKEVFDSKHVEFILKEYGKLHGLSFAYKQLHPEGYTELVKGLKDMFLRFCQVKSFTAFTEHVNELSLKSLKVGEDDDVIEKYKAYVEVAMDKFVNCITYEGTYSTILHGDCWSNNIMFKYNKSCELTDIRLIDFQFAKVGTPVSDLSYLLYSSASKEVFDNLDYYLGVYHNSLSDTIKAFGCSPEKLFPFQALKDDWKTYSVTGFCMALRGWKARLTNESEALDVTDINKDDLDDFEMFFRMGYDEERFKERSRDLIVHVCRNNFV